ncbi:threonine/serine dehydratase [Risungbinella massiliensis]|uniref:threonine/serine dehydratase n=1 Tax=Risungbinella massiliensis TaxID=1329796 RepID=UPI0005CC0CF3|nr:threonine/serine dehydratase [Risungbinella massiliensis]
MVLSLLYQKVLEAFRRIQKNIYATPIQTSRILNNISQQEVYLKCENLQRTGSFKFRGAYSALSNLTPSERKKGVVAFSSGNHAQAVALAGKLLGIKAVNCMPSDAPKMKQEATKAYRAEIILYDRLTENREEIAQNLQETYGYSLIPPFDKEEVIAGAGTATLELLQEVPDIDTILVPIGGGGLLAGTAIAAHGINPKISIIGVEPELANDTYLSFQAGKRISIPPSSTIADGLRTPCSGELTFPIIQKEVSQIVTVTEQEIRDAVLFAFTRLKIVIEPSGAVPLAVLISGKLRSPSSKVGVILSGGNIDPLSFHKTLS